MATKKKTKRQVARASKPSHQLETPALAENAREAVHKQRWRDAIADCKELLKRENQADWRGLLSEAYAGRARELAAKGMLKEALAIWENRAALDPRAPFEPDYADVLLRLGKIDAVTELLTSDGSDATPRPQRDRLRAQLAARVVGGDQTALARLPAEDPLRLHAEPALNALQAFCLGDDASARAALDAIPFRSPYRDWTLTLRALMLAEDSPEEATSQLARIDIHSAFAPLIRTAQLSLASDETLARGAIDRSAEELAVVGALRGWSQQQVALIQDVARLGPDPEPRALIRMIKKHGAILGEAWAHHKILGVVVEAGKKRGLPWLREEDIQAPSEWQQKQLRCWLAEQGQEDAWEVAESWRHCATLFGKHGDGLDPRARGERIALMLRRSAKITQLLTKIPFGSTPSALDKLLAAQLTESLEWDPDDRDTYLSLIDYHRRILQRREARQTLEQAQQRWPKDPAILAAALDLALDSRAFKKAANLAEQILEFDPINTAVRNRLINAHIGHARKQVDIRRFDLARKELSAAGEWARGAKDREHIALLETLIDAQDRQPQAVEALQRRYGDTAQGFDTRVELLLAADALGLLPSPVERQLKLKLPKGLGRDDLLATIDRLRHHLDAHQKFATATVTSIDRLLGRRARWKDLAQGEMAAACETFGRGKLQQSRLEAATAALRHWPQDPLFVLHWFEASFPPGRQRPTNADLIRLEQALDQARRAGDHRTAMRIEKALPHGGLFSGLMPLDFDDDEDEDDEEDLFDPMMGGAVETMLNAMFNLLGPIKTLEMLGASKKIVREVQELQKTLGKEKVFEHIRELLLGGLLSGSLLDDSAFPPASDPGSGKSTKPGRRKPPTELDLF